MLGFLIFLYFYIFFIKELILIHLFKIFFEKIKIKYNNIFINIKMTKLTVRIAFYNVVVGQSMYSHI